MLYQSPKNPNSHLTVKERTGPSFPTKKLWQMKRIVGEVLDFGCGSGTDVSFLKQKNVNIAGFDPRYFPDYPKGKFDTILCHYVLNVLLPEEQAHVLMAVSELLKPGGHAYFSVRRDLIYTGFRTHKKHKVKTYQCNVVLPYRSICKNDHCEIYDYQHYNIINESTKTDCPFCRPETDREIITELASAFAIFDRFPVSEGHALIIPKKHIASYFELNQHDQTACWIMVNRVRSILEQKFNPDGFNIGINIGKKAGQTIPHVHIHLIPRYTGDVQNPRGGIRHVIPGKGDY